jgi:hypothetical protein
MHVHAEILLSPFTWVPTDLKPEVSERDGAARL